MAGFKVPSIKTSFQRKVEYGVMEEQKEEFKNYIEANPISQNIDENTSNFKQSESVSKIESLFPSQHDIDINLEDLEPAPDSWNFFQLPDEETFKLIMKSIYYQGQLAPALVWKRDIVDRYMILGGHTRYTALKVLSEMYPEEERFKKMRCHVYDDKQLDEASAQFIIITNNMTQRAQEAPSIQVKSIVKAMELQKRIKKETWGDIKGRSADIVSSMLNVSFAKVNRLYKLRLLIPAFLNLLDIGTISQKTAVKYADLSKEIQEYIIKENLIGKISDNKLDRLRNVSIVEDALEILTSPDYYKFGGKTLSYEVPKTFDKFNLAVDHEDLDTVKEVFLNALNNIEFKNEKSKQLLIDLLKKD